MPSAGSDIRAMLASIVEGRRGGVVGLERGGEEGIGGGVGGGGEGGLLRADAWRSERETNLRGRRETSASARKGWIREGGGVRKAYMFRRRRRREGLKWSTMMVERRGAQDGKGWIGEIEKKSENDTIHRGTSLFRPIFITIRGQLYSQGNVKQCNCSLVVLLSDVRAPSSRSSSFSEQMDFGV